MLDISLGLLIFTAIVFFALIYLLDKMLYKPLLGFMDKRDALIRNDKESLKESGAEAKEALLKANKIISEAKAKAAKLKEEQVAKAKEAAEKELSLVKEAIDSKYENFIKELAIERDNLKSSLTANLSTYQKSFVSKIKNI